MKRIWQIAGVTAALVVAPIVVAQSDSAFASTPPTVTANFSVSMGSPLTGDGRGLLHSVSTDSPDAANLAPINPTEWRLGDQVANSSGPPAYDYFSLRSTVKQLAPAAQIELLLSDFEKSSVYNPSYANPGATDWTTLCHNVAAAVVNTGQNPAPTYDLMNEPDGNGLSWKSGSVTQWDNCFDAVRAVDPSAVIAGPDISYSSVADLETFLSNQKAKGRLPNVLTWHFDDPQNLVSDAAALRAFMTANSMPNISLVLQEVGGPSTTGHPGLSVNYFAAAEESGVEVGHACWGESGLPNDNTCIEPMLDGLLNLSQSRRPQWYAYADYAAMAGNSVTTTTNDIADVNGIASADPSTNKATVLIGANDGYAGGTVNVSLTGLGSLPFLTGASSVRVAIQSIAPGTGDGSQPVTSDTTYAVSGASATIPVTLAQYSAARLTITAASADLSDPAWSNVPAIFSDSPAIASTGPSNLFAVTRGRDGGIYVSTYNGSTWAPWASTVWNPTIGSGGLGGPTGGTFTGAPAAVAWGGNVTVAVRGTDDALWIDTLGATTGTWGGWTSLGGVLTSAPALASQNGSDLEAFAAGTGNAVYYRQFNGTSWTGWSSLGGTADGDITATSRANGKLDVFVRHADGSVWERWYAAGIGWTSSWSSIGGNLTSAPNASGESINKESVFGRGQDGSLMRSTWTEGGVWGSWSKVGSGGPSYGEITGTPATLSRSDGHTDVLVWSPDGPMSYLQTN